LKILVTGSDGQLGRCLQDKLDAKNNDILYTTRKNLDISDFVSLEEYIKNFKPDFIINAAAYTAVDLAEDDKNQANLINNISVKNIANIAKNHNIFLVHVSTDYVFDGEKNSPYLESDECCPINYYGLSKLNGENAIINSGCSYYIIRTSWVFSEYGNNFVKKMLEIGLQEKPLKIVDDQCGNPTYAQDIAAFIKKLIETDGKNNLIINYSGDTPCSWYDLANEIFLQFKQAGFKTPQKISSIKSRDMNFIAERPQYSVLSNNLAYKLFMTKPSDWKNGINKIIYKIYLK
jgi:dTDP-4-dehydrorhamnose reductase